MGWNSDGISQQGLRGRNSIKKGSVIPTPNHQRTTMNLSRAKARSKKVKFLIWKKGASGAFCATGSESRYLVSGLHQCDFAGVRALHLSKPQAASSAIGLALSTNAR